MTETTAARREAKRPELGVARTSTATGSDRRPIALSARSATSDRRSGSVPGGHGRSRSSTTCAALQADDVLVSVAASRWRRPGELEAIAATTPTKATAVTFHRRRRALMKPMMPSAPGRRPRDPAARRGSRDAALERGVVRRGSSTSRSICRSSISRLVWPSRPGRSTWNGPPRPSTPSASS